jgi:hypothetical protein
MTPDFLLSELVEFRHTMEALDLENTHQRARRDVDKLLHALMNHPKIQFKKRHRSWVDASNNIDRAFEHFSAVLAESAIHLDNLISQYQDRYLADSLRWFQHEMPFESNDYRLNRRMPICESDLELLMGRIYRWTDWQMPGMIIGPGMENHIDSLVSLDPLYLVDQHQDLLRPAIDRFNPNYQRRLRPYLVHEQLGKSFLDSLPNEQFGFCFAYNYFNFRPFEIIVQYLTELYKKIRPGGAVLFTFNDCDRAHGVALCESHYACYTPGSALIEIAESVGWVINHRHAGSGDVAWIELGKPGILQSLRGGQTLARIVANA